MACKISIIGDELYLASTKIITILDTNNKGINA